MALPGFIRRFHNTIRAYFVKRHRTQAVLSQFKQAHSIEMRETPLWERPMMEARQQAEIRAVQNGKLDIVDRRSWTWPFLPASVTRLAIPIIKSSPYNLRRCSRTPVPRRAINLTKNAIIAQPWAVEPMDGVEVDNEDEQKERIKIAEKIFNHPNNQDSLQSFMEQGIEDLCVLGAWPVELRYTMTPERPLKMWPVMVESVRLFASWQESLPNMPRYAQMTGLKGERGALIFYDDEMMYIRDNPATDSPFGLGKVEVGFQSITAFLGIQDMSGRAGTDQVHKCFPEGTEVLTRRGWILWKDAREDDEYATLSRDGVMEWQRAIDFVKEWHDGDLIHFKNRNMNIRVTPNHRMYGQCVYKDWKSNRNIRDEIGFVEARDLYDAATKRPGRAWKGNTRDTLALRDFRIPASASWNGKVEDTHFEVGDHRFEWTDWAAFLGIWAAEGSVLVRSIDIPYMAASIDVEVYRPTKGEYRIDIAQSKKSNSAKYRRIERLLERMGLHYNAYHDRFTITDKAIWEYLLPLREERRVPECVKDAPVDVIKVFIDWAVMGDGHIKDSGKRIYYTVRKSLADDMQELFLKCGSTAVINVSRSKKNKRQDMYIVEEMLRPDISAMPGISRRSKSLPKRVPYNGYVYCATVPNGTLYCRENGYPFWSGNTWLWWEQPQCLEINSEVLTKRGWIWWADVNGEDIFATRSSNGSLEWQSASAIHKADYNGPLVEFNGFLRVTPNHRVLGHYANSDELVFMQAANLLEVDGFRIPLEDGGEMELTGAKLVDYNGVVCCATVPNSTLYCRVAGYAFITGNSDSSYQVVRRHIQNELEGQAKVSIIGGMKKPEVIEIQPVTQDDLLLDWQELLIRMIANAFDMSAMALGVEHDINRAVGQVLSDADFRSAIVPMAKRIQEAFTRKILHEKLGWYDLQFRFLKLDDPDIVTTSDLCARMYSANALTPNEFREKVGMEKLESPFADLTQAEQMMLNMETMSRVQEASQGRTMEQQYQFQQSHPMPGIAPPSPMSEPMPGPAAPQTKPAAAPPQGQPQGSPQSPLGGKGGAPQQPMASPLRPTPGNIARGGQMPSPKPMSTPKFPIMGSAYDAKKVARMPLNQLTDVWMSGALGSSPTKLLGAMMDQEPGILDQMTEEVKEFFDQKIAEEAQEPKAKVSKRVMKKWSEDLMRRFKADQKRTNDFARWLQQYGPFMGRPGGQAGAIIPKWGDHGKPGKLGRQQKKNIPGKPGNINPVQKW